MEDTSTRAGHSHHRGADIFRGGATVLHAYGQSPVVDRRDDCFGHLVPMPVVRTALIHDAFANAALHTVR